jgi:hypothetical protein
MKNLYNIISCSLLASIITAFPATKLTAQDSIAHELSGTPAFKSSLFAGTQIPLQFTAGYERRLSKRMSARVQAGFMTKPYSGFIVDAMEAYGMDEYLSRVIRKSFQSGIVFGFGPNFHFGKNYLGLSGQYMRLKAGGITPADALSIHFQKDFSQFDINGLPAFEFTMQSNIINAGLLFGRQFQLRNPRIAINAEAGIAKIVASKNSFSSNRSIVDQTRFAANLYKELDEEMRSAYWKHGFIPTLNLYLFYRL